MLHHAPSAAAEELLATTRFAPSAKRIPPRPSPLSRATAFQWPLLLWSGGAPASAARPFLGGILCFSVSAADAPAAKTEYEIFLKDAGANKINVIKVVKEITGLGLGDAKAIVDGAPKTIKDKVPAEDAKKFEAQLKEAGATVELK